MPEQPSIPSNNNFLSRFKDCKLLRKHPWIYQKFSDEFDAQKFLFYHETDEYFFTPSLRCFGRNFFHAYRILVAIIIFCYLVFDYMWEWTVYYKKVPLYYGIYATNWGFLSCVFSFIYLAILHLFRIKKWYISPNASRISWFMYITSANCVMVTCVVYWLALSDSTEGIFSTLESRIKHSLPLSLVIVDLVLSSVPIRLAHVIYPASSGLLYTVFNMCYFFAGGRTPDGESTTIYPMIDWNDPLFAFVGSMYVFLVCFVMQLILFLLYLLRLRVANISTSRKERKLKIRSRATTLDEIGFAKDVIPMMSTNLSTVICESSNGNSNKTSDSQNGYNVLPINDRSKSEDNIS